MENLPLYIGLIFALTTFLAVGIFYRAARDSKSVLIILISWLAIQAYIAQTGFYTETDGIPPRFLLLVLPPVLAIVALFSGLKGRRYLDTLDTKTLTLLHVVRVPVEFVLYWLFLHKVVPELMTFEGRNFDILTGLTAPIIYYFGYIEKSINKKALLLWNFIGLGLLINIVTNAVFSAPFPFQKFAFDQPNIAVLYFPFIWLPCCIVPLVLLSHLVTIRHLMKEKVEEPGVAGIAGAV